MFLLIKLSDARYNLGVDEVLRLLASRHRRGLELTLGHNLAQARSQTVYQWTGRTWSFHIQTYLTEKGVREMETAALLQTVLVELGKLNAALQAVAETTAGIAQALAEAGGAGLGPITGPNFQRQLDEYPAFDWSALGAEAVKRDRHGATVVQWRGQEFFRRRHPDYDASVWFSRYTGQQDAAGKKVYARLVTFSDRPRLVKGLPDVVVARFPAPPTDPAGDPASRRASGPPAGPSDPKRSEVPARVQFYQLLPQLIRAGALTTGDANALTRRASREGFAEALAEAEKLAARRDGATA